MAISNSDVSGQNVPETWFLIASSRYSNHKLYYNDANTGNNMPATFKMDHVEYLPFYSK